MYVMTVEVGTPTSFEIQTIEVDQICYEHWLQDRPDEAYHWMPEDTIAIIDVVQVDQ